MGHKASKLRPTGMDDFKLCTEISAKEVEALYKTFKTRYPTGTLNRMEFAEAFKTVFPHGNVDKFSERVFESFDLDHNNSIDFREFLTAVATTISGTVDEKLVWIFQMYDEDCDGFITREEMHAMLVSTLKFAGYHLVDQPGGVDVDRMNLRLYNKMEKNEEGKISIDEFLNSVKRDPDLLTLLQLNLPRR